MIDFIKQHDINFICIQVVASAAVFKARNICKKLREHNLKPKIIVSLFGDNKIAAGIEEKLLAAGADAVTTSLAGTLAALKN